MTNFKFSILIPSYDGADVIGETLKSILSQGYKNYEIIINDDKSTDATREVVKSFKDKRIRFFTNKNNLGYPGNLNKCKQHAKGEIIYLMGQDDILAKDALKNTNNAFNLSEDIGAVARPYRWFDKDNYDVTVRARKQINPKKDEVIPINSSYSKILGVFQTLDSLSGLAYRVKFIDRSFHPDIFPCHVYPFASIWKRHPIVFLKDYTIGVRIESSQCRFLSSIYNKSPLLSWVQMFETIFKENKYSSLRNYCIKNFVAVNYVGLVQIRNYSTYKNLLREIYYLIKYRKENLLSPKFWFFSIGTALTPTFILIPMVDWFKKSINSLRYKKIEFKYKL